VIYHVEIGYGRRDGDGALTAGGIDSQISSFEDISCGKALCVPTLLQVSFFLISLTKL
jgi:hypothetical protein